MNSVNSKIVCDSEVLIEKIQTNGSEHLMEESLQRTLDRVKGFCLGIILTRPFDWCLPIEGAICMDVLNDSKKLDQLTNKIRELETFPLNKSDGKAICARNFQKKIYENIKDYTLAARTYKLLMLAGTLALVLSDTGKRFKANMLGAVDYGLLVLYGIGAISGLFHRYITRPKLDQVNRQLALDSGKKIVVLT